MTIKKLCSYIMVLSAIIIQSTSAAPNQDFSISNAEQVTFSQNTLDNTNDASKRVSFSAFGQEFSLVLTEKNDLMGRVSLGNKNIKLYSGQIEGKEDSWARLTVINSQYSGAIFDGTELYLLDAGKNINAAMQNGTKMADVKTAIYKSSEVSTHLNCASDHDHGAGFSYRNLLSKSARDKYSAQTSAASSEQTSNVDLETAAATATEQINLRIVTDPAYNASSALSPEEQVISQMNIVDGIFSEQVGVQFGITEIEVLTDNGTLTSNEASPLLTQFNDFTSSNNPGLSHLFTGRDLVGNTIGIAFLRAVCRSFGVGLTQAGGRGTLGALTAAHEFGHNFGAPHDNESGSACQTTAGTFLMNPSLNGSNQFSQCSLQEISNTLVGAQCLIPVNTTPTEPAPDCNFSIDFSEGDNDFEFTPDAQSSLYSSSSAAGGSLNVFLGGVDAADIADIDGTWSRECISDTASDTVLQVTASLTQSAEYEANEFSQISLRVNGETTLLNTIAGDGNGGPSITTGVQQYNVNVSLNAGINTIELACFNNLKTFDNESTTCSFSTLESTTPSVEEICFPVTTLTSEVVLICL